MVAAEARTVLHCRVATQRGANTLVDARGSADVIAQLSSVETGRVGAVLLVGGERNFCTGGDVGEFAAAVEPTERVAAMADALHEMVRAIVAAPVPVLAAVTGWTAGAGLSLLCLADVAIAGESARFRAAYSDIGFTPDGGLSWTLPRVVGLGRARRLLIGRETWSAEDAVVAGLVHRIVPDDHVAAAAAELAQEVASTPALGPTRRLVWQFADRTLDEHLDAEKEIISASSGTAYSRAAVAAFASRRERPSAPGGQPS